MIAIVRAVFIATLATSFLPALAVAQNASVDSLRHRVEVLERTTLDLAARVRELEAAAASAPSRDQSASVSPKARGLENWRRLRRGMTMDEVRALLGEPERVEAYGGAGTVWLWQSGAADVRFDGSGRLNGWSEPTG